MTDLKTQHLLTLAHILSKGGKHNFVNITTTSLGKEIGKSQQSASLHLKELEMGGFIERIQSGRKQSIKITSKGFIELSTLNNLLSKLISKSPNSVNITGMITSGMGEGAYLYVYERVHETIQIQIGICSLSWNFKRST